LSPSASTQALFQSIYDTGRWGRSGDPQDRYFSGLGTRAPHVAGPYVSQVRSFLSYFSLIAGRLPDVVDLGCGDFTIGTQLRFGCGRYVACDIVAPLIEFNRSKYRDADVEFVVLDVCEGDLADGDVALVRQVFQHLSNDQISRALSKIVERFDFLVLTEHLPADLDFTPNREIPRVGDWRVAEGSGVVLTAPPFNLEPKASMPLLDLSPGLGRIVTTLYRL
jgi:SAM-dependent methyltransferase